MPYLFALLSLILLLPLVMFLNIGFSKKGRLLIMTSSLFIAALGLLVQMSYPLWQIVLLILLLIAVLTYLFNNRLEGIVFETDTEIEYMNEREQLLIIEEDELEYQTFIKHQAKEKPSVLAEEDKVLNVTTKTVLGDESFEGEKEEETPLLVTHEELLLPNDSVDLDNMIEELILNNDFSITEEQTQMNDSMEEFDVEEKMQDIVVSSVEEILPNEINEVKVEESHTFVSMNSELEEIKPFVLTDRIEIEPNIEIDFGEDEIVPIKEFKPIKKDVEMIMKKEKVVRKENYLSEIEKLLEED